MSDNLPEHGPNPASFADLAEQEDVSGREVIACFENYAALGWSIDSSVVIELADRASLSLAQYRRLIMMSVAGINAQLNGGRFGSTPETSQQEAKEYIRVLGYAHLNVAQIAAFN